MNDVELGEMIRGGEFTPEELEDLASALGVDAPATEDDLEGFADALPSVVFVDDLADEARRLAEDVDGIDTDRWPYYLIDWERAGDEISSDYTCVTIGSTDYWTVDL